MQKNNEIKKTDARIAIKPIMSEKRALCVVATLLGFNLL